MASVLYPLRLSAWILTALLCAEATAQQTSDAPRTTPTHDQQQINATQQPPSRNEGHGTETDPGHQPHGSNNGPAIAAGAAASTVIIAALIAHEHNSPGHFGKNGPEVPKEFDMNGFAIKVLARPNWPVVLDFMLDTPGS